jgi:BlaI family transcriptional regulator, penicillinase repressor
MPQASLGPLEARVMKFLWERSATSSVRDVRDAVGGRLAYTTLMTTLDRLHKKGLLDRRREGRAFVYAARLSRAEFHGSLLRRLLDAMLGSGESVSPVLSSLVDTVDEHDPALLHELEQLVRRKRETGPRGKGTP